MAVEESKTKTNPPVMSTLNPNADVFVPAAHRAVEDFSPAWWELVRTNPTFREQWLAKWVATEEEKDVFTKDLEELADLDEFLEYQEQLAELEEDEFVAQSFANEADCFLDEELNLTNINNCREVKFPKQQQPPWNKYTLKQQSKIIPCKVGSYPKKACSYRIQQPRADI